jgi:4-hydroxybenzoate polyprenyltransferase
MKAQKQFPLRNRSGAVIPATETQTISARFYALLVALRPRQWTKNGALFIGLIFAQQLLVWPSLLRVGIAFIAFCLASSSIYLLNDMLDLEGDRQHPVKRSRPIASGRLPISWAITAMSLLLLLCCAFLGSIFFLPAKSHDMYTSLGGSNLLFTGIVAVYLLLMACYSTYLKHVVLIDVFIIASGFVLRILASAVVIPVVISPWLYLVTCFLSLFLALGKRRHEIVLLEGQAGNHRQILKEYSLPLLDQLIMITATCMLVSYSIYTIETPTGNHRLIITIPFVLYGMFRYLYLIYMKMDGGGPEEVLLRDRPMLGTVVVCTIVIIGVLYIWPQ